MKTRYTVKRENLETVFENLKTIEGIADHYKKSGDEQNYQKTVVEVIGKFTTIVSLGLEKAYEDWLSEQYSKQKAR